MIVYGHGDPNAKLWVISDLPREQDLSAGQLLSRSDQINRFLLTKLESLGVKDFYYDVLHGERPRKGGIANVHHYSNAQAIRERVAEYKPNLVLLLGPEALDCLGMPKANLAKWRGHVFNALGTKVLATYSPSLVFRQRYHDKNSKPAPGVMEVLFSLDLKKAHAHSKQPNLGHFEYETITNPTLEQTLEYLSAARSANVVSFDIETYPPYGAHFMDCIGISCDEQKGICIPFYTSGNPVGPVPYWRNPNHRDRVFRQLKELLESPVPKVAQNAQFDTVVLWEYYNIKVQNIVWDTMIAATNLYAELPKDLSTLISMYTDLPYHKYLLGTGNTQDRWEYCAADAIANIHVMNGQVLEMKEYNVLRHFQHITMPSLLPLIDMQITGVAVNESFRSIAIQQEEQYQACIQQALDRVFPYSLDSRKGHKFNPASPQQKQKLFYDLLGEKKRYNGSRISVDKSAMAAIQGDPKAKSCSKILAEACQEYKASSALAGRLKTPIRKGRLHTKYGLGGEDITGEQLGTETGRLNSKEPEITIFDQDANKWLPAGTNLQNLRKGPQREMVIPDPGKEFCHVDLWAAEAYVTALEANEQKYLELLGRWEKIHNYVADKLHELFPAQMVEASFQYKDAKQIVHGANYGARAGVLAKMNRMPLETMEWILEWYHQEFPGIRRRMRRIEEEVLRTRCLTSILGRKRFFFAPLEKKDNLLKEAYAFPSQSVIGEVTLIALSRLYYLGKPLGIVPALNTHDGLIIQSPIGQRESTQRLVMEAFRVPLTKWDTTVIVPIEIGWGQSFNECKETKVIGYEQ